MFVRIKSHTGSKFSRITLWQLYTCGRVVVHPYHGFSLRCQMVPQQNAQFRTVFFGQFCSILRDNIVNYGSIWTQFSMSVRRINMVCNALNDSWLSSIGGATRFANVRRKFSETNANFVPNTTCGYIAINSTHGPQHFALHAVGIALSLR